MDIKNLNATQVDSWEVMLLRSANQISLTKTQYETIEKRYQTLQDILDAATDPLLQGAHIFIQGSIGLGTTVKPAPEALDDMATIDADAVVLLPNAGNASHEAVLLAIEKRFKEGSRVSNPVEQLRRGVRIVYADENPGFHMDITPARCVAGNTDAKGYGNLEVPDRVTGWKCSSPRAYSEWLANVARREIKVVLESLTMDSLDRADKTVLAKSTQDPVPEYDIYLEHNPLKAAIKLLKRHRDVWAIGNNKQDVRPISAVITTLATHSYEEIALESMHRPFRPIEAIIQIVERMPHFIGRNYEGYTVLNPCDAGENFSEKWNRPGGDLYRVAFNDWHKKALADIQLGFQDFGRAAAFENAVTESFGLGASFITNVTQNLPRNWTLPGRSSGVTINSIALAAFAGTSTSTSSQAAVNSVDRLG